MKDTKLTKEYFIENYIRWMRTDIIIMSKNDCNFPLALCTLSYIEFLGSIFTGDPMGNRCNVEKYIDECFGDNKKHYPIDILWDVFRNGLAHDYFAREEGVSPAEVEGPAIQIATNGVKILYSKKLADDFLESLHVFENKLDRDKLNIRLDKLRECSDRLRCKYREHDSKLRDVQGVVGVNLVSSVLVGIAVRRDSVSSLGNGVILKIEKKK